MSTQNFLSRWVTRIVAASMMIAFTVELHGTTGSATRPSAAHAASSASAANATSMRSSGVTSVRPDIPTEEESWEVPSHYHGTIVRRRERYFPTKLLALTFDDGPDPTITPQILDALEQYRAHATFFVRGDHARRHPELLQRILADGDAIGNHTYSHPAHSSSSRAEIEISKTESAILAATGRVPTLFRPPYGIPGNALTKSALRRNYTVILWTISSADTRPIDSYVIANNVIHTPNPGDIVIMHDGPNHNATAEALPEILQALERKGYRFVTIPELLRGWDRWQSRS